MRKNRKGASALALVALVAVGSAAQAAEDTGLKVYWKEGLRLDTADEAFRLKIGGRVFNDWAWWDGETDIEDAIGEDIDDGVEFRAARLYIAGEVYENFIFKAEFDFAGGEALSKDIYVGLKDLGPVDEILVGHFKEPFSLEQLTSARFQTFMERSLPDVFAPSRNSGIGARTALLDDHMTVAAGFFRDTDDFGFGSGNNWGFSTRVTGTPLYANDGEQVVHLGAAYRHGEIDGDDLFRVRQRPEVHLAPRFVDTGEFAADTTDNLGVEAAVVFGPFSVQGEYMFSDIESDIAGDPFYDGWYLFGSFFVTGEHRTYKRDNGTFDRVKPNRSFLKEGGPGAWELAVRYSTLDLDDADLNGGELSDITCGVNWYMNPNFRVMFNYVNADLDHVDDANAFETRFQVDF